MYHGHDELASEGSEGYLSGEMKNLCLQPVRRIYLQKRNGGPALNAVHINFLYQMLKKYINNINYLQEG
jgi:hypothetical protein